MDNAYEFKNCIELNRIGMNFVHLKPVYKLMFERLKKHFVARISCTFHLYFVHTRVVLIYPFFFGMLVGHPRKVTFKLRKNLLVTFWGYDGTFKMGK